MARNTPRDDTAEPDFGELQLVDEPRIERFEIRSALTGYINEVTRNIDTGEQWLTPTDRTEYSSPEDGA